MTNIEAFNLLLRTGRDLKKQGVNPMKRLVILGQVKRTLQSFPIKVTYTIPRKGLTRL